MTTQSSPIITEMKVIPVAGHDSMLLNIAERITHGLPAISWC
ncbi:glucarate dehydratase [Klebsiella pneumoniae]|uniref:Glucarate dehydratase n=1 Tax=Klebsiella pneumoniae TaxID=573 RepID=A0A377U1L7_KLEPN|nr:glucarate dehydratase [Klebsiella pneumoniae]